MVSGRFLLISAWVSAAAAFRTSSHNRLRVVGRKKMHKICHCQANVPHRSRGLFMAEYDDDDEELDLDSLGDWREFRMNLINSASEPTSTTGVTSLDGIELTDTTSTVATKKKERPKSVSKRNEELLMAQNEILGEEYLKRVWAHESSFVSQLLPCFSNMYINKYNSMNAQMLFLRQRLGD